ncbi:MAG: ChbG/HpnK family deacetylase, partial [Actinomycetota bacterium]
MSTGLANEVLGWSPDARLLILNTDDFGMYEAVNLAVVESIESGVASSCTVMPPCPKAPHAMHLLRQHPQIPFGVHLTLICDFADYLWGPLSPMEKVPSLINDAGMSFGPDEAARLVTQARLDEVELELRAQINSVLDAGLQPTHLDWHYIP